MGLIERYRAEHGQVLLDGPSPAYPRLVADCTTDRDAEKIADALNNSRGAVSRLDAIDQAAREAFALIDAGDIADLDPLRQAILGSSTTGGQ